MIRRVILGLLLLAAYPVLAQVEPSASGGNPDTTNSGDMMTPPPVSGQSYPTEVGGEEQSNYLRGGVIFNASYIDNLYAGSSAALAETTYTILPTVSYDQVLPRQHISLTYRPGFTFYQPSSALNEVDESVNAAYQYRLSPHMRVSAQDSFQKSSTAYGLADSLDGGAVSGSSQPVTPGIVAPFAERLMNSASAQFSFQFSPVSMVGASGNLMKMDYPNQAEASGLFDSDERGGGGFYNRRVSASQYTGINYQYAWILTTPENTQSKTLTNEIEGFYSIYLRRVLSISVSGGVQHYTVNQTSVPSSGGWGPSVTVSGGLQGSRFNLAASYSRQVTSGGGLLGVFQSDSGNVGLRWQMDRTWTVGASGNYANNKSVTPLAFLSVAGGRSASGEFTASHKLNRTLNLNLEYDRIHESFSGVPALSNNPNSDRILASLNWEFERPLGR